MRAYYDGFYAFFIGAFYDGVEGVGYTVVQVGYRFTVDGGYDCWAVFGIISRKQAIQQIRFRRTRMIKSSSSIPLSDSIISPNFLPFLPLLFQQLECRVDGLNAAVER